MMVPLVVSLKEKFLQKKRRLFMFQKLRLNAAFSRLLIEGSVTDFRISMIEIGDAFFHFGGL